MARATGSPAATVAMAAAVAHDVCDRAIGDSVFPESLAERDVTSPECCQTRYHNPLYSDGMLQHLAPQLGHLQPLG